MTNNDEILEKAIQKAIDGGWVGAWNDSGCTASTVLSDWYDGNYKSFIFDRDFAKALWGKHSEVQKISHKISHPHGYVPYGKHTAAELEKWFNTAHKCEKCKKVVRTYEQMQQACYLIGKSNIGWKTHLQAMVISDDPVKYLADHV